MSVGNIGLIARSPASGERNQCGACYQLTINTAGHGNSGGPVFNRDGKVIAIFYAAIYRDVTVTLAVPLQFARDDVLGLK